MRKLLSSQPVWHQPIDGILALRGLSITVLRRGDDVAMQGVLRYQQAPPLSPHPEMVAIYIDESVPARHARTGRLRGRAAATRAPGVRAFVTSAGVRAIRANGEGVHAGDLLLRLCDEKPPGSAPHMRRGRA